MNQPLLIALGAALTACGGTHSGEPQPPEHGYLSEHVKPGACGNRVEVCGEIARLDCGSEIDGPVYYYFLADEAIISICGGACLHPDNAAQCEIACPPPEWTCDTGV